MNKKSYFIFSAFLFLFIISCATVTEYSIEGTWVETHNYGIPNYNGGGYYYKFTSNGRFYYSPKKDELKEPVKDTYGDFDYPVAYGNYSISNGKLELNYLDNTGINITYDSYYNGTTMYWYTYGIEKIRLSKD